jgi:prophage regulatory protein
MRLIRLKEVKYYSGLARSTVYKYVAAGTFPKPVPLGGRAVAWVQGEVEAWIDSRIANRFNWMANKARTML